MQAITGSSRLSVNDLAEWRVSEPLLSSRPSRVAGVESVSGRPRVVDEATSLLFDLDGFQVVSVVEVDGGYREALVEGGVVGAAGSPRSFSTSARPRRWPPGRARPSGTGCLS